MSKRAFEVIVAAAGLILAAPLLLLIAVAVTLDSLGPALFRQEHVARCGETLSMLEFQ